MNPFPNLLQYTRVFSKYVGRRIYILFLLTLVTGLAEGFGIALMLPLLTTLDVEDSVDGAASRALLRLVGWLGLEGSLVGILALIGGVFLFKGVVQFVTAAYSAYLQELLVRRLKTRLFDAYVSMNYLYYVKGDTGHFVNVVNNQVAIFNTSFLAFLGLMTRIIMTVVYLGTALTLAWMFGVIAVGAGVLMLLAFRRLNLWNRELSRRASRETSHLNKLLVQVLQAFKYLRSTNEIVGMRPGVMKSIHRVTDYRFRQQVAHGFTTALSEPLSAFFVIGIVIVNVAVLNQPLAPIFVAIFLFHRGTNSIIGIQSSWQNTLNGIGSVEMVRDELEALQVHHEPSGSIQLGEFSQQVEFRHVSFAYDPDGPDVLSDVSLTIPARSMVALVGESGAGKSTLVDMITLLLKPQRGEVLIDGVPGDQIDLASWRSQIGYVSQENVTFDDTIAANIALRDVDLDAEPELAARIRDAARRAHIAHYIEQLAEGYNTMVGERGIRLSAGQRQRLFIARELFRRPNVLILDEATSALDSESELAVQRSIDTLRGEMTVIIIAHRLSTIRNVDRVYVLGRGRILEEGSYVELRQESTSRLRRMLDLQAL